MSDATRYVIVKHAAKHASHVYFEENPRKGVDISFSAHETSSGEKLNIQPFYTEKETAEADCKKINEYNPSGEYAVCPVIE